MAEAPHTARAAPPARPRARADRTSGHTGSRCATVTPIGRDHPAAVAQPSAAISPKRDPQTEQRNRPAQDRLQAEHDTGLKPWRERANGLSAMPISSAMTIAGMGKTFATTGAPSTAAPRSKSTAQCRAEHWRAMQWLAKPQTWAAAHWSSGGTRTSGERTGGGALMAS